MTPNLAYAQEQNQRIQSDLVAQEVQVEQETDWYYLGEWDGKLNNPPHLISISDQAYWAGYCEGLKQYWLKFVPQENQAAEVF